MASTRPIPIGSRTARFSVIAAAAEPIKVESFMIDREAAVLGLGGWAADHTGTALEALYLLPDSWHQQPTLPVSDPT